MYEDSFYSLRGGVDGYKKLKNADNILAILTGASQVSIAVKELTDKDNVLQMAIWSGVLSYSDTHNLNFRVTMLADDHVPFATELYVGKKYNNLAIMYAQNEFGVALKILLKIFPLLQVLRLLTQKVLTARIWILEHSCAKN